MSRKVYVDVSLKVIIEAEDEVEIEDVLNLAADNLTVYNQIEADIVEAEVTDYEITDSK
jgi:hypothetical protein